MAWAPIALAMALASLVNWFVPMAMAIDPQCDYYQYVIPGRNYYIYNMEYPANYQGVVSCRWNAESPPDSRIMLTCNDISLPPGPNCPTDRLAVSQTGNVDLTDAHNYCGYGQLTLMSNQNRLTAGLFSSSISRGGRFLCTVTAVYVNGGGTPIDPPTNCDCGRRQERRIVGGVDAAANEFPSMAALVDYSDTVPFCGGTIINTRYVLTAAHCVFQKSAPLVSIVVGLHATEITASSTRYGVQRFIIHNSFNTQTYHNDIAILRTTVDIIYTATVNPICLPFRYSDLTFSGFTVTALGWGTTYFTGPRPEVLQKANLTVISNAQCAAALEDVTTTNICTYTPNRDACQFDSGGPLLWLNPESNRLFITGIISSGIACNTDNPGVNTRITSFLDWIATETSDAAYCSK